MNKNTSEKHIFLLLAALFTIRAGAQDLPDTTIMIGEVTVSAYRVSGTVHTTPGSISVLSGNELNISSGQDFATLINTVPGVQMQSGTLTTNRIVIRGMGSRTPYNSNRIRAYLNDIPVTTSDGVSTPEEIDLQGLGKIEIIKGPSSSVYGSGLGGSINMYTPLTTGNAGNIDLQYGSFNTAKAHLSGTLRKDKLILWGNLSHIGSEGYRENNNYRKTTFLSTARWENPAWSLNTTFLFIGLNGGIPSSVGITQFENSPWQAAPNWLAIKGYKEYVKGIGAVAIRNNFSSVLTGDGMLFGRLSDNFEKRPFNNLDDRSLSGGVRYKLSYSMPKAEWVSGTEIISEEYAWKLILNDSLINENKEARNHFNFFSIINYKPVDKLNISLAGALNYISYRLKDLYPANGDQSGKRNFPVIFSPRMGVNYAPSKQLALYASAGHGFSLPSPEETLLPAGDVNPGIKPEQGMQYEAGVRIGSADHRIEADASVYLIELKNLLVTKRITEDIFTGINAGRTRHQGVELLLKALIFDAGPFPGRLSSILGYTGSVNRFIEFTDNEAVHDGNFLPGIPSQNAQLQLIWNTLRLFELHIHMQYFGRQYLTDSNSSAYPGYFLGSMRLTSGFRIKGKQQFSLYAGINNLSDTHYASMLVVNAIGFGNNEPRYYYPGLPRNWYAGIRYNF